jgi:catechol 2,3-dioxygenase-like lactoylglutathione lyase family enzyme
MIRGVHAMFYTSDAEGMRSFLRDKLKLPFSDAGDGWLIFDMPEADMGCHPSGDPPDGAPSGTHHISFYCDNIEETVAELRGRGVEFTGPVENHGYGLVTHFKMPGDFAVQLYQPLYTKVPKLKYRGKSAAATIARKARKAKAARARTKAATKKSARRR